MCRRDERQAAEEEPKEMDKKKKKCIKSPIRWLAKTGKCNKKGKKKSKKWKSGLILADAVRFAVKLTARWDRKWTGVFI